MILKCLSKFWPIFIVLVLCGLVAWKNVIPGTYLTGWDNLHTEFDFKTNIIDRGINGVWQYYQGLGVPSGNAHVADLPRQLMLWMASWVVPQNLIRYGYHLVAWLGGGIGLYFLIMKLLVGEIGYRKKQVVALVASVFYLFNLGTTQNFYAPYESFSHFYLMFPWLIYTFLSYLQEGGKRKILWLLAANLLAVPMSYIPTIFIVYMIIIGIINLGDLVVSKFRSWKRVIIGFSVILLVNSFWMLPFVHFVSNNTQGVVDAKINRMFTQEAFLRNEKYGQLNHSLILEGFWFDTTDMTRNQGEHDFMMRPWMDYIAKPGVLKVLWLLSVMVLTGYLYALLSRKKYSFVFFVIAVVGLFILINTNFPTGELFKVLQDKLPLFGQVLRFPFTKFIFLAILGYSIGMAWFIELIMNKLKNAGYLLAIVVMGCILFVQRPVFEGNFFYSNLRLKIPQEYFELFKFFQKEDRFRGRIANLPQPTFWGWTTYGWGYRGSGFPWYGIPQPILDRNFDVWSPESEQYYGEISRAIYDNDNQELFLKVLDKYGVDYVWIDGWVVNPQKPELLNMSHVEDWLKNAGYTSVFNSGKQIVYKRNSSVIQYGYVKQENSSWDGYPVLQLTKNDIVDSDFVRVKDAIYARGVLPKFISGDIQDDFYGYMQKDLSNKQIVNPALNKTYNFDNQFPDIESDERTWWIKDIYISYQSKKDGEVKICLKKKIDSNCYYSGDDTNENGGYRWGVFSVNNSTSPHEIYFEITGNVDMKEIRFDYYNHPSRRLSLITVNPYKGNLLSSNITSNKVEAKNCYLFGTGSFKREVRNEGGKDFVRYTATDSSSCETMYLSSSDILGSGGKLSLETRNISGRPIKICLRHDPPGDCLVEEIVNGGTRGQWVTNTYQLPITTKPGNLYLEVDNYAVGKENRINDVSNILIDSGNIMLGNVSTNIVSSSGNVFSNNQAFRIGWLGLDIKNWKVLEHSKLNDWANGWVVPSGGVVAIFYWPQLLEYLGFGLLGLTIIVLCFKRR